MSSPLTSGSLPMVAPTAIAYTAAEQIQRSVQQQMPLVATVGVVSQQHATTLAHFQHVHLTPQTNIHMNGLVSMQPNNGLATLQQRGNLVSNAIANIGMSSLVQMGGSESSDRLHGEGSFLWHEVQATAFPGPGPEPARVDLGSSLASPRSSGNFQLGQTLDQDQLGST
eukprot:gene20475-27264_t